MPELPEVETIVQDLNRSVSGKKIKGVWVGSPKQASILVSGKVSYRGKTIDRLNLAAGQNNIRDFENGLIGRKINKVARRGKNVIFYLSGNKALLVHPKMTGHFIVGKWKIGFGAPVPLEPETAKLKVNSYMRFILVFAGGDMLGFSDARRFGKVLLGDEDVLQKSRDLKDLGPEPVDREFSFNIFKEIIRRSRGEVKRFLLNQRKVAGIGNIYSDEALWLSKIHPLRSVESLSEGEVKSLFTAIQKVLREAIKHRGTSMSDFRDASGEEGGHNEHILVYGKKGEPCRRCGTKIAKILVAGRSASFCPACQAVETRSSAKTR